MYINTMFFCTINSKLSSSNILVLIAKRLSYWISLVLTFLYYDSKFNAITSTYSLKLSF